MKSIDILDESITSIGYKPGYYLGINDVEKLSYNEFKNRLNMELVRIKKVCMLFCDDIYFDGCDEYLQKMTKEIDTIFNESVVDKTDLHYIMVYLNELKEVIKYKYPRLAFKIKNLQLIIKKILRVNI